ncbi:hypothetical protein AB0G04_38275 [Actinoplanes sp. NPDC023801]|uniref:hypothetical protein n=1 Tax=Actinoplanes sp. NPDC023801 TaxID=3154595 RepID=UPI0034052E39
MSADVVALAAAERDLDRSKVSPHTKRAYLRHLRAYLTWPGRPASTPTRSAPSPPSPPGAGTC